MAGADIQDGLSSFRVSLNIVWSFKHLTELSESMATDFQRECSKREKVIGVGSDALGCHFLCILLVKASHTVSPHSREGQEIHFLRLGATCTCKGGVRVGLVGVVDRCWWWPWSEPTYYRNILSDTNVLLLCIMSPFLPDLSLW